MVRFQVSCKSLSITFSHFPVLAIKACNQKRKGREGKRGRANTNERVISVFSSGIRTETGRIMCDTIFPLWKKKKWHMNILLRSPLFSSFSFLFSGSHLPSLSHPPFFRLDISSFVLSSIHFSCSLVYFMSNLFAAIQRASALLRHYPEIPKLLQTLSAPELKTIGISAQVCTWSSAVIVGLIGPRAALH